MDRYVALLRGINVGGNKKVPMKDLTALLVSMGMTDVVTILASGNVVFQSAKRNVNALRTTLETELARHFGFTIPVLVRTGADIAKLVVPDPFKGVDVEPETRLYITFLSSPPTSSLKIPYVSDDKNFSILRVTSSEIVSVLTVTPDRSSVDAMSIIEKQFGKNVTTRNWNTVMKIARALGV